MEKKISKRKVKVLLGKVSQYERHQGAKEKARRLKQMNSITANWPDGKENQENLGDF